MLNGHTDTVGVEGMDAPFSPRIEGGRMHGRGAYDMKSGLAACMMALLAARDMNLRGDVILSAVADEEYGSIGTEALLADWARWQADAVIIAEPTALDISIAHRGFVWLEIETQGVAAHGSLPEQGRRCHRQNGRRHNGAGGAGQALAGEPPRMICWAAAACIARSSMAARRFPCNPAGCKLVVERRTIPGETDDIALSQAQEILDALADDDADFRAQAKATFSRPPYEIDAEHALVTQLREVAAGRLGRQPALVGSSWWMDTALFAAAGVPTVALGPAGVGGARARGMGRPGIGCDVPGDFHGHGRRILQLSP